MIHLVNLEQFHVSPARLKLKITNLGAAPTKNRAYIKRNRHMETSGQKILSSRPAESIRADQNPAASAAP
jgi:hypothetical protein